MLGAVYQKNYGYHVTCCYSVQTFEIREEFGMKSLEGKSALVTGASRGLGKDIAMSLAQAGASVMVTARTAEETDSHIPGSLRNTVDQILGTGGTASSIRCDVTVPDDINSAVQATVDAFGAVDIVVNNAGILIPGQITELQTKHWDLIFKVNVLGPFLMAREIVPVLQKNGGGHIINISSRAAIGPGPGPYDEPRLEGSAYGTTKAALERFSQGLAAELGDRNIAVNALSPHLPIWSEGGHFFRTKGGEPDYSGWRMSGEIIGDAAVWICEQPSSEFTGHILYDELVFSELVGLDAQEIQDRYPVE